MKREGSRLVNRILRERDLFEKYATLFSCYDFRLEQYRFELAKQALTKLVQKLQELYPAHAVTHIRDKRALRVATAILTIENGEVFKQIYKAIREGTVLEDSLRLLGRFFPYPAYISSLVLTLDGRIVVAYNVPLGSMRDPLLSELERLAERTGAELDTGRTLPVHNCAGELGFSEEAVKKHEDHYSWISIERYVPTRMPFLDHIVVAALDWDPWATIYKLRDIALLFASRLNEHSRFQSIGGELSEKLRHRFIYRHYKSLSEAMAAGRIRLRLEEPADSLMITAPANCASTLYIIAAATLGTSMINVLDERVVLALKLSKRFRENVMELLAMCSDVEVRPTVKGLALPFPFEYYDPLEEDWKPEPVDVLRLLYRYRLAGVARKPV